MSRIGKLPVTVPAGTEVSVEKGRVQVKGPKGELTRTFAPVVAINVADGEVKVEPKNDTKFARSMWGTAVSHIQNMVTGVNTPFEKKLQVEGIGYRWSVSGDEVVLNVGYSHPVHLKIPAGLSATAEKNELTISGIDKDAVGQFAANIRKVRKPEPYKGKGIRYQGEYVRRKQGKKTA